MSHINLDKLVDSESIKKKAPKALGLPLVSPNIEEKHDLLYVVGKKMKDKFDMISKENILKFLKVNSREAVKDHPKILKSFAKCQPSLEVILVIVERDLLIAKKSKNKVFFFTISTFKKIIKINPLVREIKDVIQIRDFILFAGLRGLIREFDLKTKQFLSNPRMSDFHHIFSVEIRLNKTDISCLGDSFRFGVMFFGKINGVNDIRVQQTQVHRIIFRK